MRFNAFSLTVIDRFNGRNNSNINWVYLPAILINMVKYSKILDVNDPSGKTD